MEPTNVDVECGSCGRAFVADAKFAGGFTNCPGCGKATAVPGLDDPLWRLAQVGGLVLAVLVGFGVGAAFGPGFGIGAGLLAAGVLWLVSRGF